MLIGGVDEAGRGPAIGPMVIACVVGDEAAFSKLALAGVRDSKKLSRVSRERLYPLIIKLCVEVRVEVVWPREIDSAVLRLSHRGLNDLEADRVARLLASLRNVPGTVYVDSPDPDPRTFCTRIASRLNSVSIKLVCDKGADSKYMPVAAASIVAKVVRDRLIDLLKQVYGDFGSGYPSDPRTREYLSKFSIDELPPIVRKSWSCVRELCKKGVRRLTDFI